MPYINNWREQLQEWSVLLITIAVVLFTSRWWFSPLNVMFDRMVIG